MITQSYTAVVEKAEGVEGAFATEPYEVAWAGQALVFLKVMRQSGDGSLAARMQISPDGIEWVDEGTAFDPIAGPGVYFVKLTNFGGWLRVAGEFRPTGAVADIAVYFALKE